MGDVRYLAHCHKSSYGFGSSTVDMKRQELDDPYETNPPQEVWIINSQFEVWDFGFRAGDKF